MRCLKDKVASGHFLLLVHVLDRLGGNRIFFNHNTVEGKYRALSKELREYAIKKR